MSPGPKNGGLISVMVTILEEAIGKLIMNPIIANGREIETNLPGTREEYLVAQELLPRSVVV